MSLLTLGGIRAHADGEAPPPDPACTDPDGPLDPTCMPEGTVGQLHRQLCDYLWADPACASTVWGSPGYAADADPSPGEPFALLVGALHEHSGYSDGDPSAIPRDYFRSARTGHNVADGGGDTGVRLDFTFSSEHSDNGQIPITTSAACLDPMGFLTCGQVEEQDHYWKWPATLRQAMEETDYSPEAGYTGFTAVRGFEWTNDYFNHMNVFFSTSFRNVKVDGSYASMNVMWDWLRRPVAQGGGADALVTFNHPGGDPHLSPFDGGMPHNTLLAQFPGGANWNDLAYVPDVDDRVAGIEVNGGDDIEWYTKALVRGWHLGPVAAEDEHQREWATSADGKTLMLTRGRSPRDHYFALRNHRSVAVREDLIGGAPGERATYPTIHFYAGGSGPLGIGIQDPAATVLGGTVRGGLSQQLHLEASGLAPGSRVALISKAGGQAAPIALGAADVDGRFVASHSVARPVTGEAWWFAVVCPAQTGTACGSDQRYSAVTAPVWYAAR